MTGSAQLRFHPQRSRRSDASSTASEASPEATPCHSENSWRRAIDRGHPPYSAAPKQSSDSRCGSLARRPNTARKSSSLHARNSAQSNSLRATTHVVTPEMSRRRRLRQCSTNAAKTLHANREPAQNQSQEELARTRCRECAVRRTKPPRLRPQQAGSGHEQSKADADTHAPACGGRVRRRDTAGCIWKTAAGTRPAARPGPWPGAQSWHHQSPRRRTWRPVPWTTCVITTGAGQDARLTAAAPVTQMEEARTIGAFGCLASASSPLRPPSDFNSALVDAAAEEKEDGERGDACTTTNPTAGATRSLLCTRRKPVM